MLDPLELGRHLRELLPPLEGFQVRLLRHHPGKRCVVEITWRTAEESRSVIGKVYAKDRSAVYRLMEELGRAGLGPEEEFSIPRPVAYVQRLQLLLQEKVEGRPATESLLSDDASERTATAERCARWLANFHGRAPRIGPRVDPGSHLLPMERWVRRLASSGQPFAAKADELLERLAEVASQLPGIATRTIHGDYTHHQVILAPGRTVTVDWDKSGVADPSHDAATFIVGLQRLALRCRGSMRALDDAAEVFLRTYAAAALSDVTGHLTFQKAAICLEHAKHDVHKQVDGWRAKAAATLDEGLRVLAQG